MLCEECGKNQATVSITVTTGSGVSTRRLCPECTKKMEFSLIKGDIQSFLSSIMSVLGKEKKEDANEGLVCGGCGLSYAEFEHTGRLGCAQCYRDFSAQLKPMLQKIHGRTQHAGRSPAAFVISPQDERNAKLTELKQKMEEAVAEENFEAAAGYRDEIRRLTQEQEVQAGE